MFGSNRIKLDPRLLERATRVSQAAGYSSVDEFITHTLERAVAQLEDAGGHVWHVAASRGVAGYTTFTTPAALLHSKRMTFKAMLRGLARTLA